MSFIQHDDGSLDLNGVERISAERWRQIEVEGFTAEHDAGHGDDLVRAAIAYVTPQSYREMIDEPRLGQGRRPVIWPWSAESWKGCFDLTPSRADRIRELEKAGALIAAEIDRLLGEDDG